MLLTDRKQATRPLPAVIAAAVAGGARLVVLREKDLPDAERAALAGELLPILDAVGGLLVLASRVPAAGPRPSDRAPAAAAPACPVAGVHLAAADEHPANPSGLVGRSCHTVAEVARAAARGEHYATLSPIFPSQSKPGYGPPLGPAGFGSLPGPAGRIRPAPIPVYALGGVDSLERVSACLAAGAFGVAAMGAVMRAEDPRQTVADLLAALRSSGDLQ
jgi:thiamine monophosphate synthase